ncbi:MAG TPA: ABC transporter permease [Capillimicrobium sp.]|jgi:ribose/xylose/arabinose/galactoside ABC-type transport system permease subunit
MTESTPTAAPPAAAPPPASRQDAPGAGGSGWASTLGRLSLGRYTGVVVALLIVSIYLAITQPVFLTWDNLMNIVKANTVIFVLALGATFVVISGGIDLSTASVLTATAMIFGLTLDSGMALVPALLVTLAFGSAVGFVNGFLIAKAGISFLVVTLGALSIWASFALVVHDGQTVSVFEASAFGPIKDFVNNSAGPFPLLLIFDVILLLVAGGVLRYTSFGRALFATGSNIEAARLNGINITWVLIGVYAVAGLAAGLASVVSVGRLTAASATADPTLLLTVLAAVLIGGTSFTGGEGGVLGTVIGVLFLGVVQNGLTLSDVSTFWQGTVSGGILIIAVGLGVLRDRGFSLRQRRAAKAASAPPPTTSSMA